MSSAPPERATAIREVYRGKIITVKAKTVVLRSGRETTRDIVEHPGAVVIVAPDDQGRVALVRQYRSAVDRFLLEVPAGTREVGEIADDCARRELREEMGVEAARWFRLVEFYSAPGFCNELLSVFVATNLTSSLVQPLEDESIERIWQPLLSIPDLITSGKIVDAKSIASLLSYLQVDQSGVAPWRV
jgi:ADP-ribose pyrophosphatase